MVRQTCQVELALPVLCAFFPGTEMELKVSHTELMLCL